MHLVLDPAQDSAHGEWLRRTPGGYEWWYFDAVSEDGAWALACIWFLGNPFSPFYRLAARREAADPFVHNALFFALSQHGRLHAYHFTRFPRAEIQADETRPATLRFGPNDLSADNGHYSLRLADENANGRRLAADLTFASPILSAAGGTDWDAGERDHFWLPAAPACRVTGRIVLQEAHNPGAETLFFSGRGYHDHNWGRLPFAADIRDWYWARASLSDTRAVIAYHVDYHRPRPPARHLLLFDGGDLVRHDPQAQVALHRPRLNVFGTRYAAHLDVRSGDLAASFSLGRRLDSAPFYIRALCRADLTLGGARETGTGMAEYFRPRPLSSALVASATKARIVER